MEEEDAHRLYTLFARVNEGAKHKQGLGFGERKASPPRHGAAAPGGFLSSFVRSTTSFGTEQTKRPAAYAPLHDDSDDDTPAVKRPRQARGDSAYADGERRAEGGRPLPGSLGDRLGAQRPVREDAAARGAALGDRTARHAGNKEPAGRPEAGSAGARAGGKAGKGKGPPDYAALIPGYEDMSPAEKLRAHTRLSLAQADARIRSSAAAAADEPDAGDRDRGEGASWTRFVFNNDAHLDEEGGRPLPASREGEGGDGEKRYNSHGLGEDLDVGELNALTFRRTADVERRQQALRRAERQHEDAIFGSALPPPPPLPPKAAAPAAATAKQRSGDDGDRSRTGREQQARDRDRERDRDDPRAHNRGRDDRRDPDREREDRGDRRSERAERDRGHERNRDRDRERRELSPRSRRIREDGRAQRNGGEREGGRGTDGSRDRTRPAEERDGPCGSRRTQRGGDSGPPERAQRAQRDRDGGPGGKGQERGRDRSGGTDTGAQGPGVANGRSASPVRAGSSLAGGAGKGEMGTAGQTAAVASGAPANAALLPASANAWRRGEDREEDGPVVVDLDEVGALAAARAAAGLAAEGGGGLQGRQSSPPPPQQQQHLAETLSSSVLGQQGLSWRERALLARKRAAR